MQVTTKKVKLIFSEDLVCSIYTEQMDYIKLYTFRLDTKRQLKANRSNLLSTKFNRITHIRGLGHQLQSFILKIPFLLHYIRDISHFISDNLKTRIAQMV